MPADPRRSDVVRAKRTARRSAAVDCWLTVTECSPSAAMTVTLTVLPRLLEAVYDSRTSYSPLSGSVASNVAVLLPPPGSRRVGSPLDVRADGRRPLPGADRESPGRRRRRFPAAMKAKRRLSWKTRRSSSFFSAAISFCSAAIRCSRAMNCRSSDRSDRQRPFQPSGDVGVLHRPRIAENARQCVIVGRGNGVELVVVAAGAAKRLSQHRLADHDQLLVHHVHPQLLFVLVFQIGVGERQIGRRDVLTLLLLDRSARPTDRPRSAGGETR